MQLVQFHTLCTGLQGNASPAAAPALAGKERVLRDLLEQSGAFVSVEVEHTDDPDRLLVGLCQFRQHLSEEVVVTLLSRLWEAGVRYPYWEAHTFLVEDGHVELRAASRESHLGHYLTVHLLAQRSMVPAQREAID
ncbi:hypothetical protein [Nocardioides pakistanensis]